MRRGYKFKHREYVRYFIFADIIFGIILAALAFGSLGLRLARPDISEPVQGERSNINPECNPDRMSNDYIRGPGKVDCLVRWTQQIASITTL